MILDINKNHLLLGLLSIGLGLLIGISIFSFVFYKVKSFENTITVIGSAKEKVVSDTIKWTGILKIETPRSNLGDGYKKLNGDLNKIKKFFEESGITESQLIIRTPFLETPWCGSSYCDYVIINQEIILNSKDIQRITKLEEKRRKLIEEGINFTTYSLDYFYSGLPNLRIKLFKEAMKDARKRAESILEISNKKLGSLKSVSAGIVQVLAPNSVEISDYGTYDTRTIEKEVMVTVKDVFLLR